MLNSYSTPARPNVPPRTTTTNFPPPPRPRPPTSTKSNYPPPPSGGASRYAQFAGAEAGAGASYADDLKAKTNAFRAWEQMRHGQGPVPPTKPTPPKVPPRAPKAPAYSPPRDAFSGQPADSRGYARMSRSNTTRVPGRNGFASSAPSDDEPAPRGPSAYSYANKGERPPPTRPYPTSGPPHTQPANSKKPDPLAQFRAKVGGEEFANGKRASTPYATAGGERTYFSANSNRSASNREGQSGTEWYESEPMSASNSHQRASSATSSRPIDTSPKMSGVDDHALSSSSSSSSDSDESVDGKPATAPFISARPVRQPRLPRRPKGRVPARGNGKAKINPSVNVEDAEEEAAPPTAGVDAMNLGSNQHRDGPRPDSTSLYAKPDGPEGFMQHRIRHDYEHDQNHLPMRRSPPSVRGPTERVNSQRPLTRPRSWHENQRAAQNGGHHRHDSRPGSRDQQEKQPMYDSFKVTPNSFVPSKRSSFLPFSIPRAPPPLPPRAIPLGASSRAQLDGEVSQSPLDPQSFPTSSLVSMQNGADGGASNSFNFPKGEPEKHYRATPQLRHHSSENINVDFSPSSEWNGRFTGNPLSRPPSTQPNAANLQQTPSATPLNYPTVPNKFAKEEPARPPTVQPTQGPFSEKHWDGTFKQDAWADPPPQGGPFGRPLQRKRSRVPRKSARAVYRRQTANKPQNTSPSAEKAGEARPEVEIITEGSASSKTSGDDSAMDIDTPPSAEEPPTNGTSGSPVAASQDDATPRQQAAPPPSVSQTPNIVHAAKDVFDMGDIKRTAPLGTNKEGVDNLNDIATHLPFKSGASNDVSASSESAQFDPPNPPKVPAIPDKLTQNSWERYLSQMRNYMYTWHEFEKTMLAHFAETQSTVERTLRPDWLSATQESKDAWGYRRYMQCVEEENRIRQHWDVSWDRHRECMKDLGNVRQRLAAAALRV